MSLVETVAAVRSGVFHLVCLRDGSFEKIASGTGFLANGYLITNFHVADIPANSWMWIRQDGENDHRFSGIVKSGSEWSERIRRASEKNSYDYAIVELDELKKKPDRFQFRLGRSSPLQTGEPIAFLGFPLEHMNLTCHSGIVSSFRRTGVTDFIQIDASVNASNSGGPLFDPETGDVVGIITRKATGLSAIIDQLKGSIEANVKALSASKGSVFVGGIDPVQAAIISQNQLSATLSEIERQANVGIGYAVDIKHILEEDILSL